MGLGVGLTFIAIGAILAFATDFSVSGIDVQLIGVILMLVGAASIAFTLLYMRPRRARMTASGAVVEEPVYSVQDDPVVAPAQPHVHRDAYGREELPHVHQRREL
ncbi:DUF6458 family protein [Actinocorallia longicatena]|uniref:DUF6458 domain-containing protein n=1 Tax=Actinocorallia longicatena TaxID=111803 RepID=A0ABP6QC19_9ACTN